MTAWLIGSSLRLRRLVIAGVVAVLALGVVQLGDATLDVYPEFEDPVVQVQTEALGLSAEEVEQLITSPLEQDLLNGIPWLDSIRSQSLPGLSAIDLTFEPGTDLYLGRQMVQERMAQAAALPNVGTPPVMVQPTASTSRVAMIALRSEEVSLIDMSVLARWQLRPRLMAVPGVAQVSIWGQRERQLQVRVDPARLQSNDVTLTQLIETTGNALWVSPLSFVEASTPGTGGFIETPNQRIGVQHVSPITSAQELGAVAIEGAAGPLLLGDVADVREDHQPLIGDASRQGERSVLLVVERFPDADVGDVTDAVESALTAMSAGLTGITVDADVYRPAGYLESATGRLLAAALAGLLLMLVVLGLLTRSWRTVVVTAVSVGTSLVAALAVLGLRGTPLTFMTLLGLAAVTPLIVDDVVGDAAAISRRFTAHRAQGRSAAGALTTAAVAGRRGPLTYALLITLLALVPLLVLQGAGGAFARPALLAFALGASASLLVALVVTPVLAVLLYRAPAGYEAGGSWVLRGHDRLMRTPRRTLLPLALGLLLLVTALGVPQLGSGRLLPELTDRNVAVRLEAAAGTSLAEMDRITGRVATELRELPGVSSVASHVGRAVGADEVVDVDAGEIWVTIDDDADHGATLASLRSAVAAYPGLRSQVSSYVDDRLAAVTGSTGDRLVVRVSGSDYAVLQETAAVVAGALRTVEGVISPQVEQLVSQPTVSVQVDLAAAQRYGLRPGDVRREVSTLVSGLTVGSLYEQQAIFDVVVWSGPGTRSSLEALRSLLVHTPAGQPVRLGDVASVDIAPTPTVITHDGVARTLTVTAEVRDRDAASVVQDATDRLRQMTFPYEYRAEVLADPAERADQQRLVLLTAVGAALLAFLLLQAATASWRGAAVLFVVTPLAGSGALLAAGLVGGAWSAAVLAAVLAVVGLAARQSLVLLRRAQGLVPAQASGGRAEALQHAAREQAPAVVASVAAVAALVTPAAVLGVGPGLELLQPFAVALLGGLLTSTLVVLVVVPVLLATVGGLPPAPVTGPDTPDGSPPPEHHGKHEEPLDRREEGAVMQTARPTSIALLLATGFAAAGFALSGCQSAASGVEAAASVPPAWVEEAVDGGPPRLTLSEEAVGRLDVRTAPVQDGDGARTFPYAALVYDADGSTWVFVEVEPRVYQRAPVTVTAIEGDLCTISDGPPAGTPVVVVAAAELVGVEAGISGGL